MSLGTTEVTVMYSIGATMCNNPIYNDPICNDLMWIINNILMFEYIFICVIYKVFKTGHIY